MNGKRERPRQIFLNWLASMVDGKARKEVSAMLEDGTIDKLINDIIRAAGPTFEPINTDRLVVIVEGGLCTGIWVPRNLEIKAQVLNVDRDDPIEGSRWEAYRQVASDPSLKPLDYPFLGTEDGD